MTIKTLRYYEHRGLLPVPPRREAGYRAYGDDAVEMVRFTKRAQTVGLSLEDVKSLFELAEGGPDACATAEQVVQARMTELERRARELRAMRDSLRRLIDTCHRPPRQRECPLLQSIGLQPMASVAQVDPARR